MLSCLNWIDKIKSADAKTKVEMEKSRGWRPEKLYEMSASLMPSGFSVVPKDCGITECSPGFCAKSMAAEQYMQAASPQTGCPTSATVNNLLVEV